MADFLRDYGSRCQYRNAGGLAPMTLWPGSIVRVEGRFLNSADMKGIEPGDITLRVLKRGRGDRARRTTITPIVQAARA